MPVHTITFKLPEEQGELDTTLKAGKYVSALDDLREYFRHICKYEAWPQGKEVTAEELLVVEKIREKFYEILTEQGVSDDY